MTLMISSKINLYLVYTTKKYWIISETDNSVNALYEARKVESQLAQRKMLDIVTPSALSVEAIRKGFKSHSNTHTHTDYSECKFCGKAHNKRKCPAFRKVAIDVVTKTTSNQNADPVKDLTQKGQGRQNSLKSVANVFTRRLTA